ncbi:MAG: ComEC/Rec2 family competence protein [Myxococcota bacterium]
MGFWAWVGSIYPALLLFGGCLAGAYAGFLSSVAAFYFLALCLVFAFACLWVPIKLLRAILVFACAFSLSAALARHHLDGFLERQARIPDGNAALEGVVEEVTPTIFSGKKLMLRADQGFRLKVSLKDGAAMVGVLAGDRVRVHGEVKYLQHAMMPGDFDSYWLGLARGFDGRLSVHNPFRIRVLKAGAEKFFWADVRQSLRERLFVSLSPREAGVLLALMIGDTDFFEDEQKQIYQLVGAGHLLAVSGLQVSCLSFLFFYFFRLILLLIPWVGRLSRARIPAVILTLVAIWMFTGLTGASASAVRAALMSSVALVGLLLRRDASILETFGIAGFVTVLLAPQSVFDPSFLLSYLAIFGLLLSGPLTAGVMTLPLSAYYFGAVALGGLLANLILVPIAVFLQTPAIFLAVIGMLKPAASLAGALEALCEALGDYVGGLVGLTPPTAFQATGLIFAIALLVKRYWKLGLVACLLVLVPSVLARQEGVLITVLPVGQGDASYFEFPDGRNMVIDGGPRETYLYNFLRRKGVRKLDVLALSHPDADHIVGLFEVVKNLEVGEIWHSGFDARHPLMARLLDLARVRGCKVRAVNDLHGEHHFGQAVVTVLYPAPSMISESTNNNSMVLKVAFGATSALWPGDLESIAEQRADPTWQADVLKAPHHGSKSSSSEHLVQQVRPRHVIFCTQAQNQFGFPHESVKKRWELASAKTWDTGSQGQLQISLTGSAVIVQPYLL